jgi:hypothetical protein
VKRDGGSVDIDLIDTYSTIYITAWSEEEMGTLALAHLYLEPTKKKALQQRAKTRGITFAEEVRQALDAHLQGGIDAEELELLDQATLKAQALIAEMGNRLETSNRRLDKVLAQLEAIYPSKRRGGE